MDATNQNLAPFIQKFQNGEIDPNSYVNPYVMSNAMGIPEPFPSFMYNVPSDGLYLDNMYSSSFAPQSSNLIRPPCTGMTETIPGPAIPGLYDATLSFGCTPTPTKNGSGSSDSCDSKCPSDVRHSNIHYCRPKSHSKKRRPRKLRTKSIDQEDDEEEPEKSIAPPKISIAPQPQIPTTFSQPITMAPAFVQQPPTFGPVPHIETPRSIAPQPAIPQPVGSNAIAISGGGLGVGMGMGVGNGVLNGSTPYNMGTVGNIHPQPSGDQYPYSPSIDNGTQNAWINTPPDNYTRNLSNSEDHKKTSDYGNKTGGGSGGGGGGGGGGSGGGSGGGGDWSYPNLDNLLQIASLPAAQGMMNAVTRIFDPSQSQINDKLQKIENQIQQLQHLNNGPSPGSCNGPTKLPYGHYHHDRRREPME